MTRKNIKYIMGMVSIVYGILFVHTNSRYLRIFYFAITIMGIIGMLLSGTRSAIIIPIGGLALYCLISRNIKTIIASIVMAKCVMSLLDSKTEISAREERALAHLRNVTKGYKHNAEKVNGKKKKL